MATGYSLSFINLIKSANKDLIGVQLGMLCVDKNFPVIEVAKTVGVTRASVYNWFKGFNIVSKRHTDAVNQLIKTLS